MMLTKNQRTKSNSLIWEKPSQQSPHVDTVKISEFSVTNAFQLGDHVQSIFIIMTVHVNTGSSFVCFVIEYFGFPQLSV